MRVALILKSKRFYVLNMLPINLGNGWHVGKLAIGGTIHVPSKDIEAIEFFKDNEEYHEMTQWRMRHRILEEEWEQAKANAHPES